MTKYFMPAARCQDTRQLIKNQDLSGRRYLESDDREVWAISQRLAEDLTARTRQTWTPEPFTYTGN